MGHTPEEKPDSSGPEPPFDPDAFETLDSGIRPLGGQGVGSGSNDPPATVDPGDLNTDDSATLDTSMRRNPSADPMDSEAETVDPGKPRGDNFEIDSNYSTPGMPVKIASFVIKGVVGAGGMGYGLSGSTGSPTSNSGCQGHQSGCDQSPSTQTIRFRGTDARQIAAPWNRADLRGWYMG